MGKTLLKATMVSGTLDILFAMFLTLAYGRSIGDMLRYVASGPFPSATTMGDAGALLGLAVHFSLMALMAGIFLWAAMRRPALLDHPWRTGTLYGLVTFAVMNLVVVPLRFDRPLPTKPMAIATQLFAHIVLVGLPFAFIARRDRSRWGR
jgi:hypothetical protein